MKNIEIGDEITANYLGAFFTDLKTTAERREVLSQQWNFTCCCIKCERGRSLEYWFK